MADLSAVDASKRKTYALVDIGLLQVGISADFVVRARGWPDQLTHVPRSQGALEGVFVQDRQVIPLISIQRWMNTPAPDAPKARQVLVLQAGDKLIGLAVDAIRGLLHAAPSEIHRVHQDDDPNEFFHSVVEQTDQPCRLVSLLDPERLALKAQAWAEGLTAGTAVASVEPDPPGGRPAGSGSPTYETFALVRAGQTLLGFSAADVGEIVPFPPLQKPLASGTHFSGIADWRGVHVPVLDPVMALGLSAAVSPVGQWMLVLTGQGQHVGIPVEQILSVRRFDMKQMQATEPIHTSGAGQDRGTLLHGDERIRIIDTAHMVKRFSLGGLANAAYANGPQDAMKAGRQMGDEGMLVVFRSRQPWAASIGSMQQIMHFPGNVNCSGDKPAGVLGSFEWRGQALMLIDLSLINSQTPTVVDTGTRVIVVCVNLRMAGIVVEDVMALLPAHTGVHTRFSVNTGAVVHMVTVGEDANQKSYQVMDFASLDYFSRVQT